MGLSYFINTALDVMIESRLLAYHTNHLPQHTKGN